LTRFLRPSGRVRRKHGGARRNVCRSKQASTDDRKIGDRKNDPVWIPIFLSAIFLSSSVLGQMGRMTKVGLREFSRRVSLDLVYNLPVKWMVSGGQNTCEI